MTLDGSFNPVFKKKKNASRSSKLKFIMLLIKKHTETAVALEMLQLN